MVDMKHMKFLEKVAAADIMVIHDKESTYKGSWKQAGGRSAWFMARRNMDRLLEMMKPPMAESYVNLTNVLDTVKALDDIVHYEGHAGHKLPGSIEATRHILEHLRDSYTAEDIFAKIEERPEGADGTVLAVIRDLRRYLILVEAEMMARGVVTDPETTEIRKIVGDCFESITPAMRERRVPRFNTVEPLTEGMVEKGGHNQGPSQITERPDPPAPITQRTPEDGGQHNSLAPWCVGPDYFHRKNIDQAVADKFWHRRGSTSWVLEPYVENFQIPRVLRDLYNLRGETWVLQINKCPQDARSFFPSLPREQNMKEWEDRPVWQRVLYTWNDQANKYELTEQTTAWHAEAA
jgi:hypothetical protein